MPQPNWTALLCCSAALPLELLLHDVSSFGTRTVPSRFLGAALIMYVVIVGYQHSNGAPLACLVGMTMVLSLLAQVCAVIRKLRGGICHTRYNGKPYISILFPRSERIVKRLEPPIALVLGIFIHAINPPLGTFLIISAVCLGLVVAGQNASISGRSDDIQDALIDQMASMKSVRRWNR
jgi:hypothetical protein